MTTKNLKGLNAPVAAVAFPMPLPFGAHSRTGFELEFLAPPGKSRRDLAYALAAVWSGEVQRGFKYHSEGPYRDGRPICDLTVAWRVVVAGEVWVTLVDDVTITAGLDADRETPAGYFRVILDDLRIALWAEQRCWGEDTDAPERLLAPLLQTFDAVLHDAGAGGAQDRRHRLITDPWGHGLGVLALYEGERGRPTEIVTRPLSRSERRGFIETLLDVVGAEGFTVPQEAALHLHLDNAPWLSAPRLAQLIEDVQAARPYLHEILAPNPACRRMGPFPEQLLKVAHDGRNDSFDVFRDALAKAGASKFVDVNILGCVRRRPLHPTVEVRCLPVDLDADLIFARVQAVERFLREVALTADAR